MTPETILSELIRLKTVNPPGNEIAVARFLKQLYDRAGIPNEIIEPEQGRASIIARLGSGDRRLLYLSHSDVVGAGEGWDFDPFCGQIKDDIAEIIGSVDVPCCEDIDGHATIFPQQELFHAVEQLQSGDMPIVRIFPFCHDFPGNQLDGLADKMVCFDRISGVFFQDLCQQVLF